MFLTQFFIHFSSILPIPDFTQILHNQEFFMKLFIKTCCNRFSLKINKTISFYKYWNPKLLPNICGTITICVRVISGLDIGFVQGVNPTLI